jgi:hypothetical protein
MAISFVPILTHIYYNQVVIGTMLCEFVWRQPCAVRTRNKRKKAASQMKSGLFEIWQPMPQHGERIPENTCQTVL